MYPQAERASSAAHVGGGGGDDGCPVATRWASSCPHFRWLIGGPNSSTPQLKESRGSIYWRARRRSRAPWSRPRAMRTRTMLAGCPQSSLAGPPHVCAFLSTVRALLGKRHRCVRDGRVRCWSCPWRGRRRRRRSCACMVRPRRAKEAARSLSSAPLVPGAGGGGVYIISDHHHPRAQALGSVAGIAAGCGRCGVPSMDTAAAAGWPAAVDGVNCRLHDCMIAGKFAARSPSSTSRLTLQKVWSSAK